MLISRCRGTGSGNRRLLKRFWAIHNSWNCGLNEWSRDGRGEKEKAKWDTRRPWRRNRLESYWSFRTVSRDISWWSLNVRADHGPQKEAWNKIKYGSDYFEISEEKKWSSNFLLYDFATFVYRTSLLFRVTVKMPSDYQHWSVTTGAGAPRFEKRNGFLTTFSPCSFALAPSLRYLLISSKCREKVEQNLKPWSETPRVGLIPLFKLTGNTIPVFVV